MVKTPSRRRKLKIVGQQPKTMTVRDLMRLCTRLLPGTPVYLVTTGESHPIVANSPLTGLGEVPVENDDGTTEFVKCMMLAVTMEAG